MSRCSIATVNDCAAAGIILVKLPVPTFDESSIFEKLLNDLSRAS